MRIIIVGGSSSLGLVLKPVLSRFADVLTAGRSGCDLHLDLSDSAHEIILPEGVDAVINTAAQFGGKDVDAMCQTETVNVMGVLRLCQACTRAQVSQLVHISSIFALLDSSSRFFSMYALSKKHAEELAQLYSATYALPMAIVRPSQLYGAGSATRKHQPFLVSMIDKAACGEDIHLYGSHDARRNFIHVEDVAQAIALVVQQRVQGTYNCQHPRDVSYSEIAEAAIQAFGSSSQTKFIKDQPDIPDNIFPLDDQLFRLIGYRPQISIEQGMEKEAALRRLNP
jgi:nucleoside-diphosphate-sugar epimerase